MSGNGEKVNVTWCSIRYEALSGENRQERKTV